ncbi:MAG: hypothetical protein K8J08_20575 [Thermoanaerobaculia bacterium]|nr:hypothetical protein [Thermoanaerobaculia bacterium]
MLKRNRWFVGLAVLLMAGAGYSFTDPEDRFELRGRVFEVANGTEVPAVGGGFELSGEVEPRTLALAVRSEFTLASPCASQGDGAPGPCGCLCGATPIFADGFESGNTIAWSSQAPAQASGE